MLNSLNMNMGSRVVSSYAVQQRNKASKPQVSFGSSDAATATADDLPADPEKQRKLARAGRYLALGLALAVAAMVPQTCSNQDPGPMPGGFARNIDK